MPRRAGKFDTNVGVGFPVLVLPPALYTLETLLPVIGQTGVPPPPSAMPCAGLLDTGTNQTGITSSVIQGLGLSPAGGTRPFVGATGAGIAYVYVVDLLLSFEDGNMFVPNLEVLGVPWDLRLFKVLIGLDILCLGTFSMSNGYFTFTI